MDIIKQFMQWLDCMGLGVEAQIGITVAVVFLIVSFVVCKGADYLEKNWKKEEPEK